MEIIWASFIVMAIIVHNTEDTVLVSDLSAFVCCLQVETWQTRLAPSLETFRNWLSAEQANSSEFDGDYACLVTHLAHLCSPKNWNMCFLIAPYNRFQHSLDNQISNCRNLNFPKTCRNLASPPILFAIQL